MINLTNDQLKQLQMIELEMLEEVDRICRKNGIKYTIIAGTLLGAVRHGGFIPWDDDADVAMLRKEYDRFRQACKTDLDKTRFYFQDHNKTKGYRWGYGKLRRRNTLFLRENQENMPYRQGVFIDIFPMDNIPDNRLLQAVNNLECFVVRRILWAKVGKNADKKAINRHIYRVLDLIPEGIAKRLLNGMIAKSKRLRSKHVRMLMFPSPRNHYGYKLEWYEKLKEYDFEGIKLFGISDYDAYLRHCYGEYMMLPPKAERKVHPVSSLRLLGSCR